MAQPPLVLDSQPADPVPDGLFQVATGPLALPDHANNQGAIWLPDTCGGGELAPAPCQAPPYASFTLDPIENIAQAWPYVAYATLVTGPVGISEDEAKRRVVQRLVNTEQYISEIALWGDTTAQAALFTNVTNFSGVTGGAAGVAGVAGGVFQQLANVGTAAGFYDLGTATDTKSAVSLLEQSAADHYYGRAIVHARPRMAAWFGYASQFRVVAVPPMTLMTQNQNLINFGNGYKGTGPTGQAPDATTEYVWATGRVVVWRGNIMTSPTDVLLNRTTNQRGIYAWRPYMIGVECFSACVKVTRA